jgi:hypothetical protein
MDHPCHRCGAPVPENTPFCSQCGAPQIRVSVNRDEEGENPSPPPPIASAAASSRVIWSFAFPRALLAALIGMVFLAGLGRLQPPLIIVLLFVSFTGAISVWLYGRRDPALSAGKGFRLGMITGFLLALILAFWAALGLLLYRAQILEQLQKQLSERAQQLSDPRMQEMVKNVAQNPDTLLSVLIASGAMLSVIFIFFCGIGGAIAGRSARHHH